MMELLKRTLIKLLFPHTVILVLLVPAAAAMLIYALAFPGVNEIFAYVSYAVSAYVLAIVCVKVPVFYQKVKMVRQENRYIRLYLTDPHLRVKISLYGSVSMNSLYALMQLISGLFYHSVWFYALAGYYALLVIIRIFLLRDTLKAVPGENRRKELYIYRFCGILMLMMNQALAVIVFYIVWQNRGFEYHYIHTIAMAAYTFTAMTAAVINAVKYRRYESPVMSAAKAISLASALVSVLTLETAMLTAFDEQNDPYFRQMMTGLTGAGVCIFILGMAVYMLVWSNKEIKKLRN